MMNTSLHRWFFWATNVVVVVAVGWGFFLAGSPGTERLRKLDERRVSDLQNIKSEIVSAVTQRNDGTLKMSRALPSTLEEAASIAQYQRLSIQDPETGELYEYSVLGTSQFQLCAVFSMPRAQQYDVAWDHDVGRQCFRIDVLNEDANTPVRPVDAGMTNMPK